MKKKEVLIIYNYIAHYRIPIFNLLSKSKGPLYTIMAGDSSEIPIKIADQSLAEIEPEKGGIRWKIIRNRWFFKYFLWQGDVIKQSMLGKYDTYIYLGNMYYFSTWIGSLINRIKGNKVIFWTHGYIREEKNLQGFIRKIFYSLSDEILTYGFRAKNILISKGFDSNKISVVYNSLDFDRQLSIIEELNGKELKFEFKNNQIPAFGFIGRLTKQKNLPLLIDALNELHKSNFKSNLLIIGDGESLPSLRSKVKNLGLSDYVVFFGACYDEKQIYQLLKSVKVIVSPGEVGLTAIHSMTYGVPVLTHNRFDKQMPEYECIKQGLTGGFFDYGDPLNSLVEHLKIWLSRNDVEKIESNCKEVIHKYYNPYVQKEIFDNIS